MPEGKTVKNRLHLDLVPHTSQDRDAEIARLERLGARRVDVGQSAVVTWTVPADPEGNEVPARRRLIQSWTTPTREAS